MPDDVEKESGRARRQSVRSEERRRRRNEQRLEGQRRENERKTEALRKKATADEVDDAARRAEDENANGRVEGGASVDQLGGGVVEPQRDSRSDGRKKLSKRKNRREKAKAKRKAQALAKNEHPELHVIAQVTPLAPPSPPLTPCEEASLHSENDETCRQGEDFRTRMEADYLFDPPRCANELAASAPSAVEESAQTREAAADVLFFELPRVDDDSTEAAIVPIVKIGRASAAFYRNSGEPGYTRPPQKFFRGRGRGRGFGWYGRGGRVPRSEPYWANRG